MGDATIGTDKSPLGSCPQISESLVTPDSETGNQLAVQGKTTGTEGSGSSVVGGEVNTQRTGEVTHVPAVGRLDAKRKFSFKDSALGKERGYLKFLLVQCVREHDAHRAGHGELDRKFQQVLDTFIENLPNTMWCTMQKPAVKTLRDKYRGLVKDRKAKVASNLAESGIVEDISELDQLLDDLMHERDDLDTQKRQERQEMDAREESLVAAGEEIRQQACVRQTRRSTAASDNDHPGTEQSSGTGSTPKKRRTDDVAFDEWQTTLAKELESKRACEKFSNDLRAEELKLHKERWEEEKKDREERRKESSAQLQLLKALINKLT